MHTAESNFSNFVIKYLGKIETELENWVRIMEKNRGRKSRDTLPLSIYEYKRRLPKPVLQFHQLML